jgi:ABC-2 type transport system permease protein
MARHDPLLPNAGIIARREYRDRIRGPLFLTSTVILMFLALLVALAPIAIRYFDRQVTSRVAVVSTEAALAQHAAVVADTLFNAGTPAPATGTGQAKPYEISVAAGAADAERDLRRGIVPAVMNVERKPDGGLAVTFTTNGPADLTRTQTFQVVSFGLGVLDWYSRRPADAGGNPFVPATVELEALNAATDGGRALGPQETASRAFLGVVFVVLLFMTVVIYGMWVATGVAAEKSSRVMELMISAASPRQLITGKVVGIGAAGLTQYAAIAVPALIVLLFQDRIAAAILGPSWQAGAPLVGLTPSLLIGYAVFFLLGFALFALIYAAMGSFVSRPDDLQTLSLPLRLLAVVGYLTAIAVMSGGGNTWTRLASFVPPFSPFVMLARVMVSAVQPWEIALAIAILLVAVAFTAVLASRMYAAGVLLYGQRPGLRAFLAAARRAG